MNAHKKALKYDAKRKLFRYAFGGLVRSQIDAKGGPKRLPFQYVIASFYEDALREVNKIAF